MLIIDVRRQTCCRRVVCLYPWRVHPVVRYLAHSHFLHVPSSTGVTGRRQCFRTYVFLKLIFPDVCYTTDKIKILLGATEFDRPRRSIIPTAKLIDASNSSKPALKSHQAAADAQRAAEARKAAELKAVQQAAELEEVNTQESQDSTAALAVPLDASQSQSSSQILPSRSQTPGTQFVPSDDDLEEIVGPVKGKRKAMGMCLKLKFALVNHR